jgi:hypothetical protein
MDHSLYISACKLIGKASTWVPYLDRRRAIYEVIIAVIYHNNNNTVLFVHPCGNFSDTSSFKSRKDKGSLGHTFMVCISAENQNQKSFYPYVLHEISVLIELLLGHLC